MAAGNPIDFWYAVNNTRVVLMPVRRLETFGTTLLNYHMISELMDTVGQIRVREGRILSYRPQIVTPASYAHNLLEGFGEAAEQYADWLREHARELRILQYGFKIKKEELNQHVISDSLNAVIERVEKAVRDKEDPLAAVLVGVDDPWEVCLLKMMAEVFGHSFPGHVREMERHHLFDEPENNAARAIREDIETHFQKAAQDAGHIAELGRILQKSGLFKEYEDRFFALLKNKK